MMKWVTFWLMVWCFCLLVWAALCSTGCATFSNATRPDLTRATATATEAKAVAQRVCEFDWNARECYYLVESLKRFYVLALTVEKAKAEGHDVTEAVKALEELSGEILGVGKLVLKRVA
jgi:hypothetical protein